MRVGKRIHRCYEVIESLSGGDPSDVEQDRSRVWNAQALAQVAGYACGRFGEAVSPHRYALWRNSSGDDVVLFAFRRDDDSRRAAHDSAIKRRVEPTLQTNLA